MYCQHPKMSDKSDSGEEEIAASRSAMQRRLPSTTNAVKLLAISMRR
jgi:hypothetical protein